MTNAPVIFPQLLRGRLRFEQRSLQRRVDYHGAEDDLGKDQAQSLPGKK